jgi:hypothetical protein
LDKGKLVFGYKQIDANRDVPLCRHDGWLARQSSNKFDSTLAALRHYKALLHDGLLARQSTRNLDSALATLRHCQPKYELFSLEKVVKSPISSRNAVSG